MQKLKPMDDLADTVAADEAIDERYIVPGLSRGLALLQLFTRSKPEQKLTEIAEGLGLSRSAAYRLVYTLEKEEFLRRDPHTRRYRLTSKVLTLGFEFLNSEPLTEIAQPFLRRLSDLTGATSYLIGLEGWHVVHLARAAPSATLITNLKIGARFPVHAVTSGRVILANIDEERLRGIYKELKLRCKTVAVPATFAAFQSGLEKVRERGYDLSKSMFEAPISACACAVKDRSGNAVASISIVAPHALFGDRMQQAKIANTVRSVVEELSAQLGYDG